MSSDLAVVGAGAAGAAAAYALRDAPVDVVVFEAADRVGGRTATRESHGCRYDHGANYLKADSPRVSSLVTGALSTDGLVDVAAPVHTFDAAGTVAEGHDPDDHKWTYEGGIATLVRRLFAGADAEVRLGTQVGRFSRGQGNWRLLDDEGGDLGTYDAVLSTPPAPVTADVLAATEWDDPLLAELRAAVDAVPYRSILSALLHYPFEVDAPWYGLVNVDREHEVGWLSREELKPGHVPDGESLLVVQMAPDWSADRFDAPPESVTDEAAALVADLLDDERFADPDWTGLQRWRHALPDAGVDSAPLEEAEREGLYFAGDWVAGDGRVHLAVESGLEAGERIAASRPP
jgi:predicted NAD/FAD-dependent oxidoreductase